MNSNLLSVVAIVLLLCGCKDQDVRVGISDVSSSVGRRVVKKEIMGSWEFKYTNDGRWDVSCRPPGIMSEFGLSFWTSLRRAPKRDRRGIVDFKVFTGSRFGQEVVLMVERDGSASIAFEEDDDFITHVLSTPDRQDPRVGKFFREVYLKN